MDDRLMDDWWSRFKTAVLWLIVWSSLGFLVYFVVQRGVLRSARFAGILEIPVDHVIPFWPGFVWIYITLWLVIALPFFIFVLPRHIDHTELIVRFMKKKFGLFWKVGMLFLAWLIGVIFSSYFIVQSFVFDAVIGGIFAYVTYLSRGSLLQFISRIIGYLESFAEFIFGYEPDERRVRKARSQILISYFLVIMVLALSHYFFPFKVERPRFDPTNLTLWVLTQVYHLDAPTSLFPSLHASFAFLTFFIFNRLRPAGEPLRRFIKPNRLAVSSAGLIFLLWAIAIVASTYFVKQHVVLDGIAGFFLAYSAYRAAFSEKMYTFLSRHLPTIFPQV